MRFRTSRRLSPLQMMTDVSCIPDGSLFTRLRPSGKKRRQRYGSHDSRGRFAGNRHISERPAVVNDRSEAGNREIDNGTEFHDFALVEEA
jgi:hypothetical protein